MANETKRPDAPETAAPKQGLVLVEIVHGAYVHRLPSAMGEPFGHEATAQPGDLVEVLEKEAKRLTTLGVAKIAR